MFSGLSRRQFLRLISSLIAAAAAVASIPFIGKLFASNVQAQEIVKEVKYKNRTYSIRSKVVDDTAQTLLDGARTIKNPFDVPVDLYLDGQKVNIVRDKRTGKYATSLLPFAQYDSPEALGQKLIDLRVAVPNVNKLNAKKPYDSEI